MELLKTQKSISVITAAVLSIASVLTAAHCNECTFNAFAEETKKNEETEISILEKYEEYESGFWWKANLSDYDEKLALVTYETVDTPKEAEKKENNGIVVNDTGISYTDTDPDYHWIEIIAEDETTGEVIIQENSSSPSKNSGTSGSNSYSGNSAGSSYTTYAPEPADLSNVEHGNFSFTTYGYGHGLGLSQNGANHYATYSGWNYQQILSHYYPGTYIQKETVDPETTFTGGGITGNALDIVSMVTYNEVGGSMADEAIKAQAVAAYTYLKYNKGNASDLRPKANPPQRVVDLVSSVLGEAVYYDGSYANTVFGASSGGSTASCYDIFYGDIPYLRSVPCEYDSTYDQHYGTVKIMGESEVRSKLEAKLNITLSDNPENWFQLTEGDGGYIAYVLVDGQVKIKGNALKIYLGLKSPKFTVAYH